MRYVTFIPISMEYIYCVLAGATKRAGRWLFGSTNVPDVSNFLAPQLFHGISYGTAYEWYYITDGVARPMFRMFPGVSYGM